MNTREAVLLVPVPVVVVAGAAVVVVGGSVVAGGLLDWTGGVSGPERWAEVGTSDVNVPDCWFTVAEALAVVVTVGIGAAVPAGGDGADVD